MKCLQSVYVSCLPVAGCNMTPPMFVQADTKAECFAGTGMIVHKSLFAVQFERRNDSHRLIEGLSEKS